MFNGKTKRALDTVSGQGKGKLHLSVVDTEKNITLCDVLESKHPSAAPLYPECLETMQL